MQKTPQWAQNWCPIHLIGTQNAFLTTDARMDSFKESDWEKLLAGRSVLTNAFTDCEAILGKENETFSSLDLILTESDIHSDVEVKRNPKLGKDTSRMEGEQIAPYGTALQILERLAEEGLKIGALPELKPSDYLRRYPEISAAEKLPPHPEAAKKIVAKDGLRILLMEGFEKIEGNPICPLTLHCYQKIGIEWTNSEGTRWAFINPERPFIRVILTNEALFGQNPNANLEFLCNPAFLELSKKDTDAAQKLVDCAGEDAFFYQSQDAEQCYFDLNMFNDENRVELDTLWSRENLLTKAKETFQKALQSAMEEYLDKTNPEIGKKLKNSWKNGSKLHLKFLQLKGGKITYDATLETKAEAIFFKGEAGSDKSR